MVNRTGAEVFSGRQKVGMHESRFFGRNYPNRAQGFLGSRPRRFAHWHAKRKLDTVSLTYSYSVAVAKSVLLDPLVVHKCPGCAFEIAYGKGTRLPHDLG